MTRMRRLFTITTALAVLWMAGSNSDVRGGETQTQFCNNPQGSAPDVLESNYVDNDGCGPDLGLALGDTECFGMCSNYLNQGAHIYEWDEESEVCTEENEGQSICTSAPVQCWEGTTPCICDQQGGCGGGGSGS